MRPKIPALTEALTGHFGPHQAVAAQRILGHLEFLDVTISALTAQIDARTASFDPVYKLLLPVPGLERPTIGVIVAETGRHEPVPVPPPISLHGRASARVTTSRPANDAGWGQRPATSGLRRALIEAARAAVRTKGSYFGAQYSQIARRRGPKKAAVAVAHSLVEVIWHLLSTGEVFEDLGDDYSQRRRDPDRQARRLVAQLEELGFAVTITAP